MLRIHPTEFLLVCSIVAFGCAGDSQPGDGEGDGIGDWNGNLPDEDDANPTTPTSQKLLIESPERGAMISSGSSDVVRVSGRVLDRQSGEDLTINGQTVDIGADGRFTFDLLPKAGVNIIAANLSGFPGARAQRTFQYGVFASLDEPVAQAAALRINREGFSDDDGELDDISSVISLALVERDPIKLLPASYSFNVPVIGTVNVSLTERRSGPPTVRLVPRSGGVTAYVRLPNVYIRHRLTFNCAITTCNETGTATADAIEVVLDIDATLQDGAIDVATRDGTIDIVNLQNDQDGAIASAAQTVIEYFVPDLERRIENLIQPGVAAATSADFSLALGQVTVPVNLDLRPALELALDIAAEPDTLTFSETGALIGLAMRASAEFGAGDPGNDAPGWLYQTAPSSNYQLEPPFGVSMAMNLMNQLMFAVWGQGALAKSLPLGSFGYAAVAVRSPPVVIPEQDGKGLVIVAGDILVDASFQGAAVQLAVTVVARAELIVDAESSQGRVEMIGNPVLYAEMIDGPDALTGQLLTAGIELAGPKLLAELIAAIQVPLPSVPLGAIAPNMAGKVLRLAPPTEFVTGEPPARVTFYGRLLAM